MNLDGFIVYVKIVLTFKWLIKLVLELEFPVYNLHY